MHIKQFHKYIALCETFQYHSISILSYIKVKFILSNTLFYSKIASIGMKAITHIYPIHSPKKSKKMGLAARWRPPSDAFNRDSSILIISILIISILIIQLF